MSRYNGLGSILTEKHQGGLGYTDERLRKIFKGFQEIEIRKMREMDQPNEVFSVPDFLTALFQKR